MLDTRYSIVDAREPDNDAGSMMQDKMLQTPGRIAAGKPLPQV
jgi:hypothetical protein